MQNTPPNGHAVGDGEDIARLGTTARDTMMAESAPDPELANKPVPEPSTSTTARAEAQAQQLAAVRIETVTQRAAMHQQPAAEQISISIGRAVGAGQDRIRVQLSPAELGHVDVRLELNEQGRIEVVVRAERPETLELLQRDARELARGLQNSGLNADASDMQFELGDERENGRHARNRDGAAPARHGVDDEASTEAGEVDLNLLARPTATDGHVDIRI